MKFGIAPPNWGPFGNPLAAAQLARLTEDSGWDGYFTWDGLPVKDDPPPTYDPWIILSSVAMSTQQIRIGTCVAVVPRYKPHLLAMTLASIDVLSGGRLILGVGIGDWSQPRAFEAFGEPTDSRIRAEMADEALDIVTRLWSGERVEHHGKHYRVDGFSLKALPVQSPRIPIWVGGDSPAAIRRAARWDGWIGPDDNPLDTKPEDVAVTIERLREAGAPGSFSVAWAGTHEKRQWAGEFANAGATWWVEILLGDRKTILDRVAEGPPA